MRNLPAWTCGFALAGLLAGCSLTRSDLDQTQRMQGENLEARARESVFCKERDLVCARLVQMHGDACALTANDAALSPDTRVKRRDCALSEAASLPGLLPADAPPADQDRAALMVFDAWRSARDGGHPAATPEALAAAAATLRAMPAGAPYADALAADTLAFGVLSADPPDTGACTRLRQARHLLPPSPSTELAPRVESIGTAIRSAAAKRSCVT